MSRHDICTHCNGTGQLLPETTYLLLRQERKARGLSLADVATMLKVSPMYISMLERGTRKNAIMLERYMALLSTKTETP